jgi:hypothetical protein
MSGPAIDIYLDKVDFSLFSQAFKILGPHLFIEITSIINQPNKHSLEPDILVTGLVSAEKQIQTVRYLVSKPDCELKSRIIKLKDGSGSRIVFDQNYNPDSEEVLVGGIANDSTVVATTVRTTGETKITEDMFMVIKKLISQNSTKAGKGNFVFPSALDKLKSGCRLAPYIESHESLNIKLS